MMRIDRTKMSLECALTDTEKLAYGKELAQALNKIQDLDGQLSRFKDSIKGEITTCETNAASLSRKLDTGKEFRDVECRIDRNWDTKIRTWTRTDTGEVVKEDIIPEHEMQEEMELNQKKQADAVEAAEDPKAFDDPQSNVVHFEKGRKKGKK